MSGSVQVCCFFGKQTATYPCNPAVVSNINVTAPIQEYVCQRHYMVLYNRAKQQAKGNNPAKQLQYHAAATLPILAIAATSRESIAQPA